MADALASQVAAATVQNAFTAEELDLRGAARKAAPAGIIRRRCQQGLVAAAQVLELASFVELRIGLLIAGAAALTQRVKRDALQLPVGVKAARQADLAAVVIGAVAQHLAAG